MRTGIDERNPKLDWRQRREKRKKQKRIGLVFVVLIVCLCVGGFGIYRHIEKSKTLEAAKI